MIQDEIQDDMDSYFALRHADELENYNIARSALDGLRAVTSNEDATSIAVNNGSVDFISDGTTCTDYDDNVPNVIDDEQTFDSETQKFTEKLDIGYHYDCGQNDILGPNQILWSGIIHPQKEIPILPLEYNSNTYYLEPKVNNSHEFGLETVDNPNTVEDYKECTTVVAYHTDIYFDPVTFHIPNHVDFVGHLVGFLSYNYQSVTEENNEDHNIIKWYTPGEMQIGSGENPPWYYSYPYVSNIATTSIKSNVVSWIEGGQTVWNKGTIFAGCVIEYSGFDDESLHDNPPIQGDVHHYQDYIAIDIYRYDSMTREWVDLNADGLADPIARMIWEWTWDDVCTCRFGYRKITDVSLCMGGNNLWVFWTAEVPQLDEYGNLIFDENQNVVREWKLYGGYVSNPIRRDGTLIMAEGTDYNELTPINPLNYYFDDNMRLDCGYDDDISYDAPRIVFADGSSDIDIHCARVVLDPYKIPTGLTSNQTITLGQSANFANPAMCMNKALSFVNTPFEKAFNVFYGDYNGTTNDKIYKGYLDGDTWYFDDAVDSYTNKSYTTSPDIEARGFGIGRFCYDSPDGIATNTELMPDPSLQSININIGALDYPRIGRNIENKTDMFVISTSGDGVVITQIDP